MICNLYSILHVVILGLIFGGGDAEVKFINIVGIEGVGHHLIEPLIISTITACHGNQLFGAHIFQSVESTKEMISNCKPNDVLFARFSFPAGREHRVVSKPSDVKQKYKLYDLELKVRHLTAAGVVPKFFYVSRDLYEAINSHAHFDKSFENHTRIMGIYLTHILNEFHRVESIQKGLWRRLDYVDIQKKENVKSIMTAMVKFFGWHPADCNMSELIANATRVVHPPTQRTINEKDLQWVKDHIKVDDRVIPPLVTLRSTS